MHSKRFEMTERSMKELAAMAMNMRAWQCRSRTLRHNIAVKVINEIGGHTSANPIERRAVYSALMNNVMCPEDLGVTAESYLEKPAALKIAA